MHLHGPFLTCIRVPRKKFSWWFLSCCAKVMYYYGNSTCDVNDNENLPAHDHHGSADGDKSKGPDSLPIPKHSINYSSSPSGHNHSTQQQSMMNNALYIPLDHNSSQFFDSQFMGDPLFSPTGLDHDTLMPRDWEVFHAGTENFSLNHNTQQDQPSFLQQHAGSLQQQSDFSLISVPEHHHRDQRQNPDNFLSSLDEQQQAILFSDPSFVRQRQLLQEEEMRMGQQHNRMDNDSKDMPEAQDVISPSAMTRSNLSAMFDRTLSGDKADRHHSVTSYLQAPSVDNLSADNHDRSPTTSPASQDKQTMRTKPGKTPTRKDKRRSGGSSAVNAGRTGRATSPIPISGVASTSQSSTEIDHQRRFNELQARFRINYARKSYNCPSSSQKSSAKLASSYSGDSSSSLQGQASLETLGKSMPSFSSGGSQQSVLNLSRQSNQNNSKSSKNTSSPSTVLLRFSHEAGKASTSTKSNSKNGTASNNSQNMSFPSRTMPIQIQRMPRNACQPVDAEQHQRQLDEQLEKVDFDDITVSELKDMLRQRGKPATGKKAVLIQRLQEELELVKSIRSGHAQRPPMNIQNRPKSYQGSSSPTISHSPISVGSPSSMPNSSMLYPGSPNSVTMSLNGHIANMHIGSPPTSSQHMRRYSPYATPGSPRLGSSPKLQHQRHSYSSSLPTNAASPFPGSPSLGSPSSTARYRSSYFYGPRPKTYAPFTSSALATPDRDDDQNPFDTLSNEHDLNDVSVTGQAQTLDHQFQSSSSESVKQEGADMSAAFDTLMQDGEALRTMVYIYSR